MADESAEKQFTMQCSPYILTCIVKGSPKSFQRGKERRKERKKKKKKGRKENYPKMLSWDDAKWREGCWRMEAAFPFPSTLHWSWRALHRDHGQAVLCLQELLGVTPQGREGAPLLPPVLRAKKPHPHPPQPPSQTSPPPWKLGSVPHSGVYASLATLKTIPKTDKKDKKTKKLKGN